MKAFLLNGVALIGLAGWLLLSAGWAQAVTTRVSVDSAGGQVSGYSKSPSISADGRFVAFTSSATNLVAGDTNGQFDIFVHDRQSGTTTRVNVDSAGGQANNYSSPPSLSADGRFVAFSSDASNLVAGDTNGAGDIFVHDRQTGTTTRVSVDSTGGQANSYSYGSSFSADGRFVAFASFASNLVAGDTNGVVDAFVHDRQSGTTTRVNVDSAGGQANNYSTPPSLSADGRFVAFASVASNLVAGDTNNMGDIFVHDRQTGTTTAVSVDSTGGQANNYSSYPSLSADGRFVTFESFASNLVAGDTNGVGDAFVHDRQTSATTRVSVDSVGGQASGWEASISADGRFVAFASVASNLVAGDTNGVVDAFVHDRQSGTTTRVNVDNAGNQANVFGYMPSISADGRFVVFESGASNLVAGDTNGTWDIFVHQLPCGLDSDCDGTPDTQDNCLYVPNGPLIPDAGGQSQRDTNGDGFGNLCDADLNNDGLVTVADYMILRSVLNTANADADLNGDGQVTARDAQILRGLLNQAPGPGRLVP